jgi:hypothetical protein
MRFSRRRTLMLLGWTSALPLLPGSRPFAAASQSAVSSTAQLRALMRNSRLAAILGRAYRAAYPAEADAQTLTGLLCLDLGLSDAPRLRSQQLLAALDARIRAQFGAGETVVIRGWVLARTEARLCALCD